MKYKLTLVALATIGTMASAQAAEVSPELKKLVPAKTEAVKIRKVENADFGVYKLLPDLALAPASLAADNTKGTLSGRTVVQQAAVNTDGVVKTDAVVRNLLTGELGVVTGRLSILANDAAALQRLQQDFGLKLVKAVGNKIAIVQAPAGANLTELVNSVRKSGLVKEARLDVVEKLYKPN
ncbi:hypothetical protein [Rheinheimera sp. MM224]|uniref:hypothetical protein n=1 Tax=Rheinheimera sp. MM224 TaxID=3019969 RepID=UPI0021F81945|nr:hypothetical protein [Rheinheimera sp. MM224]CAI3794156.1 hypothetical protein JAMGFMIE_00994 [Rheinheimera sp. MM224]